MLHDPQIVNGLQTSQEIFNYFSSHPKALETDDREVLVKIIASDDTELHDKVIRATNAQISIPVEFLWATDQIHREIATFFERRGLYYDRRKSSWRREQVPLAKVVGITELAQSVAAIRLQEPDNARARPSRYFQDKASYRKVFDPANPREMYVLCAEVRKRAVAFLRAHAPDKKDRNNLLYYVMMIAVSLVTRVRRPRAATLAALDPDMFTEEIFMRALTIVAPIYADLGNSDSAAKGPELSARLKQELFTMFGSKSKGVPV